MKKIINGKMYNTDTAIEIDCYTNMNNPNNYGYYKEILYRKKTGEFFLYGHGNASSKYATVQDDRMRSPGKSIIPLTEKDAMRWVEQYSNTDTYIDLFGEVEE